MDSTIGPYIHHKVVVLHEDDSIHSAARAMTEHGFGTVVISNRNNVMVGIVTDRDLACRVLGEKLSSEIHLKQVMSQPIVTISENADLAQAVQIMVTHGIRRLPAIKNLANGTQRCVGMISLDDLLLNQSIPPKDVEGIIKTQVRKRMAGFPAPHQLQDEKWDEFLSDFSSHLPSTLHGGQVEDLALRVLEMLFRRLPFTAAMHILAKLPSITKSQLVDMEPGPDRRITETTFLNHLRTGFNLSETQAQESLQAFWKALQVLIPPKDQSYIWARLSSGIRSLFEEKPKKEVLPKTSDSPDEYQFWV